MPFVETINRIPFAPRTAQGAGFLPPIVRAQGHILYLLGCLAEDSIEVGVPHALGELAHAREHWHERERTQNISDRASEEADTLELAIAECAQEYEEWTDETRLTNIRSLANRVVQYAANLDRELVGLTSSDPGSTL